MQTGYLRGYNFYFNVYQVNNMEVKEDERVQIAENHHTGLAVPSQG